MAGLTMAVAIILQYMAGGATWIEARLRIPPVRWMAMGLLFATATGAGAWLVGYPFLTSHIVRYQSARHRCPAPIECLLV